MCGTFIDTIIVCTITGLAIASSGVLGTTNADGKMLEGAELTIAAFETALGKAGAVFVTISIILFAFSTIHSGFWRAHCAIAAFHSPRVCACSYFPVISGIQKEPEEKEGCLV